MKSRAYWQAIEDKTFLWLLVLVSIAFAWILWPFFGAIMWGTVLAIVFAPLYRRLARAMQSKRSLAALVTALIVVVLVILPVILILIALMQEGATLFAKIQSGEINPMEYVRSVMAALPAWLTGLLERFRLTDAAIIQERVASGAGRAGQSVAAQVLNVGQNAFDVVIGFFLMLYLLFFLLRDGEALSQRIRRAIPIRGDQLRELSAKFTVVIRATIKGTLVVAVVQGALGAFIFWILGIHAALLWGALMAIVSLLPAVGAALVWGPVAIFLLATGAYWQAAILTAFGVLVIGLVDNLLRPILVGKDTRIPDYVVLFTTIGAIAIFGLNGFVLGPVVAAMFIATWEIFSQERGASAGDDDASTRG